MADGGENISFGMMIHCWGAIRPKSLFFFIALSAEAATSEVDCASCAEAATEQERPAVMGTKSLAPPSSSAPPHDQSPCGLALILTVYAARNALKRSMRDAIYPCTGSFHLLGE